MKKFIFFAEDLNENVYKIDKMMTQLLNIEKFRNNLQGIILGDFLRIESKKNFDELFYEIGEKIQKPILSGFKITHARAKQTFPNGGRRLLLDFKQVTFSSEKVTKKTYQFFTRLFENLQDN